jgi:hypothetical protein
MKSKIKPHFGFVEPGRFAVKSHFHERVIVNTPSNKAKEEENFSVQCCDNERLQGVAFFLPL